MTSNSPKLSLNILQSSDRNHSNISTFNGRGCCQLASLERDPNNFILTSTEKPAGCKIDCCIQPPWHSRRKPRRSNWDNLKLVPQNHICRRLLEEAPCYEENLPVLYKEPMELFPTSPTKLCATCHGTCSLPGLQASKAGTTASRPLSAWIRSGADADPSRSRPALRPS